MPKISERKKRHTQKKDIPKNFRTQKTVYPKKSERKKRYTKKIRTQKRHTQKTAYQKISDQKNQNAENDIRNG